MATRTRVYPVRLNAHRATAQSAISAEAADRMSYEELIRWRDSYDTRAMLAEMRGEPHEQARAEATVTLLDRYIADIEHREWTERRQQTALTFAGV